MPFVGVLRAQFDYLPQSEEELEIKDGDLLLLVEKSAEDDWWTCKKKAATEDEDEPEGLVPANYVENAQPTGRVKALYDYTNQTDEELSFKEDMRLEVYDESDPDWTLVGYNGEYGFAPAIYLDKTDPGAAASASASELAPAPAPVPRTLAPPPMPARPPATNEPIPGEADYPAPAAPSISPPISSSPAAQLAGVIAQRTGGAQPMPSADRGLASSPLPTRPAYTPDESDEEAPPSLPNRPPSQTIAASPPPPQVHFAPTRSPEPPSVLSSPPYHRAAPMIYDDDTVGESLRSPGGFHLYNIHEMVQHMGKNKKMPMTLGINIGKGMIMISPEKSRDGPSREWTAEKLTHYSIEGKHVFVELVRPSKSVDFHAGAKDTAQEIVAALGELAGAVRQEGLREVLAASAGTGAAGKKTGRMLYEFTAQGQDEVTVAPGDEVIILDDVKSEEWWMVRRMKNGKEGVVPSSYIEVTGFVPETISGLESARTTVEQNRLEEQRLAKEAAKRDKKRDGDIVPPERHSSLIGDTRRTSMRGSEKRNAKDQTKSKPNPSRIRTWTDRTGTFKVEAEFIGLREGKIHLHKMNGVKIAVPVTKMSVEDLEYVERATGASLDEDKPLSDIKRRSTLYKQKEQNGTGSSAGASIQKKDDYDWFDFFLQCGVNPQICERYAAAFSKDQMGPEILPEVNEQLLRTLGLKEGDILRVMKHLDTKYDRKQGSAALTPDGSAAASEGGLFSGPGGSLRNNTRKGRPAPAVQTNDIVDENAFKPNTESPAPKDRAPDATATPLVSAPKRDPKGGFDDDAWDVKPSRTQTPTTAAVPTPPPAPAAAPTPPQPKINDDIASLSISAPPLQPTPAALPAPATQAPQSATSPLEQPPQQAPVANQAIFDKIASLAPAARQQQPQLTGFPQQAMQPVQSGMQQPPLQPQQTAMPRQRPAPPLQQANGGALNPIPPPRAASAPGFPPQPSSLGQTMLQPQLTGYQPQQPQPYPQLQPQPTSFPQPQAYGQGFQPPQQTGIQSVQQNYPALQPQPTGFQPQSQFGQQQQSQQFGLGQPNYQQQFVNGQQNGSPFADPSRQPFVHNPSGLSNSFTPSQTGFQPSFNLSQPTGMNGFGSQQPTQPQMPPQQSGGVFGPSQPVNMQAPAAPLIPQKTGPPPPVRFGVQPGAKPLMPQPTGRANLSKATPQNPFGF